MAGYIGAPAPFDHRKQKWSSYQTQFEHFLKVNDIKNDEKKTSCFIALMGSETYEILEGLMFPDKPASSTVTELFAKLTAHFEPKRLKIAEQYKFWRNKQGVSQTLADYISEIRKLASTCQFPQEYLQDALTTAFVLGLRDENISRKLLAEKDLTLDRAIATAQSLQIADKEAREMATQPAATVDAITHKRAKKFTRKPPPGPCPACGSKEHWRSECPHKNATCLVCHRTGHLAKVCRDKNSTTNDTGGRRQAPSKSNPSHRTHLIEITNEEPAINEQLQILETHVTPHQREGAIVNAKLNGYSVNMQLDTGATVTLLAETTWEDIDCPKLQPSDVKLQTYSQQEIPLMGQCLLQVQCQGRSAKLLAVVSKGNRQNLLGRTWIDALELDLNEIYHMNQVQNNQGALDSLLRCYSAIFQDGLGRCHKVKVHLTLKPDAQPKFCKSRLLPFSIKPAVEQDLERQVHNGVLQRVEYSEWATPIVVVPKPSKAVRICGDFSVTVNPQLKINQYPIPRPEELFAALNGGEQFTKLDFSEAYLQLEESQQFMVINTHKGLFKYTRLPFGIAAAPAVFQQTMDIVLQGLPGVVCYLDDIIITGKDKQEHLNNLEQVLSRIQEFGFRVRKEKCFFMQDSVEYLGHIVSKNGIQMSPKKVEAIVEMPRPKDQKELRAFLGMINHYSKFMPNLSDLCAPLNGLLQKTAKWRWSKECEEAVHTIKDKLGSAEGLVHFNPSLPIFLAADASSVGIGAVIFHRYPDGTEKAIAHASKTLTPSEKNYSQIEREALALIYGVKKFHQYLWGREFTLQTDYKPLTTIFGKKKGIPPTTAGRLQRWALILMGYSFHIEYKSTAVFGNADGLSRLPAGPDRYFDRQNYGKINMTELLQVEKLEELPVKASDLAAETNRDPVLKQVKNFIFKGWPTQVTQKALQPYLRHRNELTVQNGCILYGIRVVIPPKFQSKLLQLLHETHPGKVRMKSLARSHMWWPTLDEQIESVSDSCKPCAEMAKDPAKTSHHKWEFPERPWQRLHIDYAGPFLDYMWLIIVDAHSKWPIVIPTKDTSAEKTSEMLLDTFATHGFCEQIVSDNGSQFTSEIFKKFCDVRGIQHTLTAPYHPQSNGEAERFVQTFKTAMMKSKLSGEDMKTSLRNFLARYRVTPHCTTGIAPCELLMKRHLRTKLDLIQPTSQSLDKHKKKSEKQQNLKEFNKGDKVWARNYRKGQKWVQGVILDKIGQTMYHVKVEKGLGEGMLIS